jgi:hypothetical protein
MELIKNFFMICSPSGRADFTASAVLQAIRSEAPRLHGLRLVYAANSAREKSGLRVRNLRSNNSYNFNIIIKVEKLKVLQIHRLKNRST